MDCFSSYETNYFLSGLKLNDLVRPNRFEAQNQDRLFYCHLITGSRWLVQMTRHSNRVTLRCSSVYVLWLIGAL
jgi:hypothetical protein